MLGSRLEIRDLRFDGLRAGSTTESVRIRFAFAATLGMFRMGRGYTGVTSKTAPCTAAAAKPSGVRSGATPV
jgi:hypothetical protein